MCVCERQTCVCVCVCVSLCTLFYPTCLKHFKQVKRQSGTPTVLNGDLDEGRWYIISKIEDKD